jgi:hypothetical protein
MNSHALAHCRWQSLGCDAVWSCTWLPAFRRNVCPLYSFYPQNRPSQISEISTLLELLTDVKKIKRVYPTVLRNITSVNQINYYSSSLHLPAFIILLWNLELSAVPWLRCFSPACHRGGTGSRPGQSTLDLWWTKRHWYSFSTSSSVIPYQYYSTVDFLGV